MVHSHFIFATLFLFGTPLFAQNSPTGIAGIQLKIRPANETNWRWQSGAMTPIHRKKVTNKRTGPIAVAGSDALWGKSLDSLAVGPNGQVAVGSSDGLFLWNADNNLEIYTGKRTDLHRKAIPGNSPLPGSWVQDIEYATDGSLWVATNQGILKISGSRYWTIQQDKIGHSYLSQFEKILLLKDGRVVVGGRMGNISIIDPVKQQVHTIFRDGNVNHWVTDMVQDTNGNIWIAMRGVGIFKFDFKELNVFLPTQKWIPGDDIRSIAIAPNGSIWVGSSAGLGILHPNGRVENFTQENGLPGKGAWWIEKDTLGQMWVRCERGIAVHSKGQWRYPSLGAGPWAPYSHVAMSGKYIWSICENDLLRVSLSSVVWKEGNPRLSYRADLKEAVRKSYPNEAMVLCDTLIDKSGRVWIGLDEELWRYDGKQWENLTEHIGKNVNVSFIVEDRIGRVLIGTSGNGLVVFENKKVKIYNRDTIMVNKRPRKHMRNFIRTIHETSKNIILVGTGHGLFELKKEVWRELISGTDYSHVAMDKGGRIWVASHHDGITLYSNGKVIDDGRLKDYGGLEVDSMKRLENGNIEILARKLDKNGFSRVVLETTENGLVERK